MKRNTRSIYYAIAKFGGFDRNIHEKVIDYYFYMVTGVITTVVLSVLAVFFSVSISFAYLAGVIAIISNDSVFNAVIISDRFFWNNYPMHVLVITGATIISAIVVAMAFGVFFFILELIAPKFCNAITSIKNKIFKAKISFN